MVPAQQHQPAYVYYHGKRMSPTMVSFTPSEKDGKHYLRYGAVRGSKRVRHELDMCDNTSTYDTTLKEIAEQRRRQTPVVSEIMVVPDSPDSQDSPDSAAAGSSVTAVDEIARSLSERTLKTAMFWEDYIDTLGLYGDVMVSNVPPHLATTNTVSSMKQAIRNNDVLKQKFHKTRSIENSSLVEHKFTVLYRFACGTNDSMLVHGSHCMVGNAHLNVSQIAKGWRRAAHQSVHSPQYWGGVTDEVYYTHLCKIDGWAS